MNLQTMSDKARRNEIEKLRMISEDIKNIGRRKSVKIDKDDFETFLLPYMINEVEYNDENRGTFILNMKKFADSYNVGLSVVDGDELLFNLPPIMLSINEDKMGTINVNKFVNMVNGGKDNAFVADRILRQGVDIIEKELSVDEDEMLYYNNELYKVYKKYEKRIKKNKGERGEIVNDDYEDEELY